MPLSATKLPSQPLSHPAPSSSRKSSPSWNGPVPQAPSHGSLATRFGVRLRSLRHARGMTQLQVAIEFGIDRTFLSDLERGRKSVSLPFLEVFALGYGLSLSDLLDQL